MRKKGGRKHEFTNLELRISDYEKTVKYIKDYLHKPEEWIRKAFTCPGSNKK